MDKRCDCVDDEQNVSVENDKFICCRCGRHIEVNEGGW